MHEAGGDDVAHVDLRHQPADDRRGEEHGDAGDEHGLADHQRAVAAHFGEIARIHVGQAVKPDADAERDQAADAEIAVGERPDIDDRLLAPSARARRRRSRRPTQIAAQTATEVSCSHSYCGPSSSTYSSEPRKPAMNDQAPPVEMVEQLEIRLVEIDQRQHADGDADAGNDVDEEQPVPRHQVGDDSRRPSGRWSAPASRPGR